MRYIVRLRLRCFKMCSMLIIITLITVNHKADMNVAVVEIVSVSNVYLESRIPTQTTGFYKINIPKIT